jgi:hypothetical protein
VLADKQRAVGALSAKGKRGQPARPRDFYKEKNDTAADMLALLDAYVYIALEQRYSVPKDIERVVASAFQRYLKAGNYISLDEAFGLTGRQKAGHPVKSRERLNSYSSAMIEVARYQVAKGLSQEVAVAKVAKQRGLKKAMLLKMYKTRGAGKSLVDWIRRDRKGRPDGSDG